MKDVFAVPSIYNLVRLDRKTFSKLPQPYSNCLVLEDNALTVPLVNRTMFDLTVQQGYAYILSSSACPFSYKCPSKSIIGSDLAAMKLNKNTCIYSLA